MKAYPNLSKPIMIGNVKIKNRMMMAPMDTGFGNNAWGGFTPEGVEYFARRAEGGFGLLFSGGFGAAKNLCNYAFKGADMEVQPDVARAIVETREAGKPLGGMCISPVLFAKLLPGVCITLGNEGTPDADNVRKMGAFHVQTEHGDVCADNELLVFTTPAYMLDATVKDVYDGAYNMVEAILETIEEDKRK